MMNEIKLLIRFLFVRAFNFVNYYGFLQLATALNKTCSIKPISKVTMVVRLSAHTSTRHVNDNVKKRLTET